MGPAFDDVTTWVFDLDNTLYPPEVRLFDQIEERMTQWITDALNVTTEAANRLRAEYWAEHGTTLAGLIAHHDIDPMPFLGHVHDIDFGALTPDPDLAARIDALPGRKIVYTNGDADYAGRVLAARGLTAPFEAVYGVEHAGFEPKPKAAAFDAVFALAGVDGPKAAMFEDEPRNLIEPHARRLRTVHVAPQPVVASHIQYHTDNLSDFLAQIVP